MIDNKYMKLRGNRKNINGQLTLIPIIKTDQDTVQELYLILIRKSLLEDLVLQQVNLILVIN